MVPAEPTVGMLACSGRGSGALLLCSAVTSPSLLSTALLHHIRGFLSAILPRLVSCSYYAAWRTVCERRWCWVSIVLRYTFADGRVAGRSSFVCRVRFVLLSHGIAHAPQQTTPATPGAHKPLFNRVTTLRRALPNFTARLLPRCRAATSSPVPTFFRITAWMFAPDGGFGVRGRAGSFDASTWGEDAPWTSLHFIHVTRYASSTSLRVSAPLFCPPYCSSLHAVAFRADVAFVVLLPT